MKMHKAEFASFFLRFGLAFVFTYAVFSFFSDPDIWIRYFPDFVVAMVPFSILSYGFAAYEVILSLWLLSGRYIFFAAVFSAATLFGIIVFNLDVFNVLFRNVAIFFSAVALAVLNTNTMLFKIQMHKERQNKFF